MHRNSIHQHISSEGTVYVHAFRNSSRSTHPAPSNARNSQGTDVTPTIDSSTANAMIPSLSGA